VVAVERRSEGRAQAGDRRDVLDPRGQPVEQPRLPTPRGARVERPGVVARGEPVRRDLGLLAVGSAAFILALTLAQGLIALRGYRAAAMSWVVGIVVFVVATALGHDLLLRVELGFAFGSLAAAAAMGALLVARMRTGVLSDVDQLFEVIGHEPLEI
jgi:hypothetical protein